MDLNKLNELTLEPTAAYDRAIGLIPEWVEAIKEAKNDT